MFCSYVIHVGVCTLAGGRQDAMGKQFNMHSGGGEVFEVRNDTPDRDIIVFAEWGTIGTFTE